MTRAHGILGNASLDRWDALVVSTIASGAAVLGWPVLAGGLGTYLDNPVHLAEVDSLVREGAWSDIALAGFPLGILHSPLWYGALALAARAGLPVAGAYAGLLWLAACAPPLAVYGVGRSRAPRTVAAAAAFLLLIQPPSIAGIASPFGGMWTHSLALAGCVVLLGVLLASRRRSRFVNIAALSGAIGLTHAFALPVMLVVLAAAALVHRSAGGGRWHAQVPHDVIAIGLGFVCSVGYWAALSAGTSLDAITPQHLDLLELARALATPTDIVELRSHVVVASPLPAHLGVLPMVALIAVGILGASRRGADPVARAGGFVALAFLALLVCAGTTGLSALGPLSWRHLAVVRAGFALGALGVPWSRSLTATIKYTLALAAVASCALWGAPLRADVDDRVASADVERLWSWLRENREPTWGRVFVQDTFFADFESPLRRSHVLARTASETGVRQVGAYYGVVPFRTARITSGEGGRIAGLLGTDATELAEIARRLGVLGVTHAITATESARARIVSLPDVVELASMGRFTVLQVGTGRARWVDTGSSIGRADARWLASDTLAIDAEVLRDDGTIRAKVAMHPWWRLSGPPGAHIRESQDGLVLIEGLPAGPVHLEIRFVPPSWPSVISALAWLAVLAAALVPVLRNRGVAIPLPAIPEHVQAMSLAPIVSALVALVAIEASPLRASGADTVPGRYGALAVLCEASSDLRSIDWIARREPPPYHVRRGPAGELVSSFGPGPALLGSLGAIGLAPGDTIVDEQLRARTRRAAALATALAAALLALAVALRRGPARGTLAGVTAALSFAGAATLGQDVWQQTAALPLWLGALAIVSAADRAPRILPLAPALLGLAFMVRPGVVGVTGALTLAWAIEAHRVLDRRAVAGAIGAAVAVVIPAAAWNLEHLGSLLPVGQIGANVAIAQGGPVFDLDPARLGTALAGLLVSPARGVLWFAPIAVAGVVLAVRDRPLRPIALGILLQLAIAAAFHKWWGGLGFGPRLLAEAVWLGIYAACVGTAPRVVLAAATAITLVVGVLGLARHDPRAWEIPRDPDHHAEALWDVVNPPFRALTGSRPTGPEARDAPGEPFVFCAPRAATAPR